MAELNIHESQGLDDEGRLVRYSYIGIDEGLVYIMPFVENNLIKQDLQVTKEGKIAAEDVEAYMKSSDADLLIVAADKQSVLALRTEAHLLMPFRIHQIVHTSREYEKTRRAMSQRELKRYDKMRQQEGFDYFVTYEDADFDHFYDTMHKPTMNSRYGEFARSVEKQTAYETLFKKGLLFLVTQNGEPVSGSVSQFDKTKNWLNARLIGVRNGDDLYRTNGAQNFVYHAIIHWASNVGMIDVVDFQGCEPFLTKGTLQYKKRFATEAILPPNHFHDKRLLVQANLRSPSVRQFLIDNPMLVIDEADNIGAGYPFDQQSKPRLELPYQCPGIDYHVLIDLDEWAARAGMEHTSANGATTY
ncbi:MAG: hypothetical protein WCC10_12665 [Tumebacillaceae bacterium]